MFSIWGKLNIKELTDFSILLPKSLRMPYSLLELSVLKILDINFSTSCDAKNDTKKTSKKLKKEALCSFLKLLAGGPGGF